MQIGARIPRGKRMKLTALGSDGQRSRLIIKFNDHIYYFESSINKEYVSVKTCNFLEDISDHLRNYLL